MYLQSRCTALYNEAHLFTATKQLVKSPRVHIIHITHYTHRFPLTPTVLQHVTLNWYCWPGRSWVTVCERGGWGEVGVEGSSKVRGSATVATVLQLVLRSWHISIM